MNAMPSLEKPRTQPLYAFPIYPVNRPDVTAKFKTVEGKTNWHQWVQTIEEVMNRLEQWEHAGAGKVKKDTWDRHGEVFQELRYMRRAVRNFVEQTKV